MHKSSPSSLHDGMTEGPCVQGCEWENARVTGVEVLTHASALPPHRAVLATT